MHMAGGELDGEVVVARCRHGRDMEYAVAHVRIEDQAPGQLGALSFAFAQQLRRRGRDHQPGRRPVALVELLS